MASFGIVRIDIKDLSQVSEALSAGAQACRELAALKKAIRERRDQAGETLRLVRANAIVADDEGYARSQVEADTWDEVAALLEDE